MFYYFIKAILNVIFRIIFRVKVIGKSNIPKYEGFILCSNHRSNFDAPVIGTFVNRKIRFMGKKELFEIPVLGYIFKVLGGFPVTRNSGDIGAIKKSLQILKENEVLFIFPEGARSFNNKLRKAKPGVALIATRAKVPIVPIGVTGEYKLFHKITINIGEPKFFDYNNKKLSVEELQNISNDIMGSIQKLLEVN